MAGRIKGIMDFVAETIKDAKYDRAEFDPRFYPGGKLRVKDSPEYRPNVIDTGTMIPQERLALQDLEGRPYFTTMSDRTAAGGLLEGIGNKPLAHPIRLTGGQDYMRDDTGELWASGAGVVPNMVRTAKELEDQYGSSPVFMPWRMAPSGGDFAHMTGQTMLSWAAGNMPKVYKKQLDADMKKFVPDWAGVDDPKSLEQYGALSDTQRKTAMNMLDKEYRNKGGISQTQARLAVSDQSQLLSPVSGFQNVGEVDLKRGVLEGAGNATYPSGLAGDYLGTLDTDVTAMDLNPERYARALKKDGTFDTGPQGPDLLSTRFAPRRAMEVGYWGGLIDEALLRRLSEEGFKVNSGLLPGVATAGVAGASLLGSEDADASMVGLLSKFGASRADLKGMADKMLDAGASPNEIWAKTGWEYNEADKLWRTELPNSKSELNLPSPGKDQKARAKLGDIINDPELLSQYDDRNRLEAGLIFDETEEYGSPIGGPRRFTPLSDIPVIIDNNLPVGYGFHAPASGQAGESIRISGQGTPESQRATLLHEMQHSIQDREGFASGGSEEYFKSNRQATNKWSELYGPRLQDLQDKRLKNEDEIDEMMGLEGLKSSITRDYADSQQGLLSPEQMYRNLVGEVEAENVVTRDSLTPDDLRIKRPGSTEQLSSSDILGRDQQIVRMGSYDPIDQEVGLLTNRRSPEYTEAPVIEEQSFGSMVQEYGDINRRAQAADDQKFGLLMAGRSDRAGMSRRDRRDSPASPELQEFTKANAVPSLLQFASGVGEGGVDYLKDTFSGGGYVTAPAYASQQYEDINRDAMMAPEEAKAPLRPEQIYLDPRMAEEAERLRRAGMTTAGILSMLSPI
jgi:hypothetical protein